jgi:diaminopimelate epimerase
VVVEVLRLSKHEAAGNDFLVLVEPPPAVAADAEIARALCDRHRGVGADGLIVVRRGDGRVGMELRNADGSTAEMSGNGMRCLAQAAVAAGLVTPPRFEVDTLAGPRLVQYRAGPGATEGWATVEMGPVTLGARGGAGRGQEPVTRWQAVDVGNPHVVAEVGELAAVDLERLASDFGEARGGPVNVEVVAPAGSDRLAMRVWERGVGPTLACGTGSVAAAAAARGWGLVGNRVQVDNPGGTLEVMLAEDAGGGNVLAGPVRHVADVSVRVPLADLPTVDIRPTSDNRSPRGSHQAVVSDPASAGAG